MADIIANIVRDPSPDEISGEDGFVPIVTTKGNIRSPSEKFHAKVEKLAHEFDKSRKPFCRKCAYQDYKRLIKNIETEKGYVADFKKLGLKLPDLKEYGDEKRFEIIEQGDTKNPGRWAGDPITFDKWIKYKCKIRGCLITIFQEAQKN